MKKIIFEKRKNKKCSGYGQIWTNSKIFAEKLKNTEIFLFSRKLTILPFLEKNELLKSQLKFNKRRIVVAGLAAGTSDEDLKKNFEKFGKIEKAFIVKNDKEIELKPYGHIVFKSQEAAEKAINGVKWINGTRVQIKTHKINIKKKIQAGEVDINILDNFDINL